MRRRTFAIACTSALLAGCGGVEGDERDAYTVDRRIPASTDAGEDETDSRACPPVDRAPPDDVTVGAAERYARSLAEARVLEREFDGDHPADDLETAVVAAAERDGGVRADVAVRWASEAAPHAAVLAADTGVEGTLPRRSLEAVDTDADGPIDRAVDSVLETGTKRRLHDEPAATLARTTDGPRFLLTRDGDAVLVRTSRVPDRTVVSHFRFVDGAIEWSPRVDFRRSRPVAVPEDDWTELECRRPETLFVDPR